MKQAILLLFGFCVLSSYAQRTETLYLSGTGSDDTVLWDFFCTAGRGSGEWTQIPVPSNWEFHGFGQFTYGHDEKRINESGMYRYRFTVPEDWKNKKVNIVFEGSMTDTEVKVNGRSAGKMHQGGYYCFRYDIGKLLKYGKENLLEVTVHKSSANETVEAAERKADFWVYGGIYRPVWLEALPPVHIERVAIDATCGGLFRMDVFLSGNSKNTEVSAQVKTMDGKAYGVPVSAQSLVREGEPVARLSGTFENPALWSAEFPNRYQVEVSLHKEGKIWHTVCETFGFRTVELRPGDGFYVNGSKVKFKGVDRHTHWPTSGRASNYTLNLKDVELIKEMNMNAVRMSHYPPDRDFLYTCDSLGLYVIDELTAWQYPPYDTPVGKEKVKQLITRDVNHPSVVMWANGNEGGFNFELLPEYSKHDIQNRHVIHPWLEEEQTNTYHYPSYGVGTQFLFNGNKVFFPTETIHGLYDGGHGAGLNDFWNLMQSNPLSAGCFLWDFADAGVVRNDKNNEIDTDGDHGADGIVGPYREKEGSFYTVKEIWSPIYIEGTSFLPPTFDGTFKVENRYNFTNLNQCSFTALWVKFDYLSGKAPATETPVTAPDIPPGFNGLLKVELPSDMADYDALRLTAKDVYGKEIYTWTRTVTPAHQYVSSIVETGSGTIQKEERGNDLVLNAGRTQVTIDKTQAVIREISVGGKRLSLANGPRYTCEGMALDDVKNLVEDGIEKIRFSFIRKDSRRPGKRNIIQLALLPSEWVEIDYTFDVGGYYDYIGITFDYPENKVKRIKWLGNGPYRVWKNRLKGVTFNIWEKDYNNTVTGESWDYPEFKGYHSNLYAADLTTDEGVIRFVAASDDLYLHLFTPDNPVGRNNDNTLGKFPDGQLSILNAVSPVGTKFRQAEDLGPQSQRNYFQSSGHASPLRGKVYLKYIP
ncbi:MAG: glycoside hydrolase family 2 [Tannerella sp.]|nr:glycoside hydrolase family 2 [Tannerella sp.]